MPEPTNSVEGGDDETVADAPPLPSLPPVAAALVERFPGSVAVDAHGQSVVYVDRAVWHDVAAHLHGDERFTQCVDVTAVDHLADTERVQIPGVAPERFEVVANFLSHPRNLRVRVICEVPEGDTKVAASRSPGKWPSWNRVGSVSGKRSVPPAASSLT